MTLQTAQTPNEQQAGAQQPQQLLDEVIAAKVALKQWQAHLDTLLERLSGMYQQGLVPSKGVSSDGKRELALCSGKTTWTYSDATNALARQLKAQQQYEQIAGVATPTEGKPYWQVKEVKQPPTS